MAATIQLRGSLIPVDSTDGVERPGPGRAPVRFRIWKAGPNICRWTGGPPETFQFTARSAELLAAQQKAQGREYPFDLDHRSLKPKTDEDGKAAGWHSLEFPLDENGNPECWASACRWDPEVKADLESEPPRRRYFSPVWDIDEETMEINAYVNCAVTNNPATYQIPSLAASLSKGRKLTLNKGATNMDKTEALAALGDLLQEPLTDTQKAKIETLSAFLKSVENEKPKDEEAPEAGKAAKEGDETDPEKKPEEGDETDPEKKPESGKSASVESLQAEILRLRKEAFLDKAGITGERKASLMSESIEFIEKVVKYTSRFPNKPNAKKADVVRPDGAETHSNPALKMLDDIGNRALAQINKANAANKAGE